jgi:hypothetical protein
MSDGQLCAVNGRQCACIILRRPRRSAAVTSEQRAAEIAHNWCGMNGPAKTKTGERNGRAILVLRVESRKMASA